MLLLFVVVFVSLSDSLRTELSISFLFSVVVSLLHYYARQTVDFCGPRSPGMWKLTWNAFHSLNIYPQMFVSNIPIFAC